VFSNTTLKMNKSYFKTQLWIENNNNNNNFEKYIQL